VSAPYEKPTTFTGQFAESFVSDYLKDKQNDGSVDDSDALIESAISAVESSIVSKVYAVADIVVVPATESSIRDYGNAVAEIMRSKPSSGEQEVVITAEAIKANNPEALERLEPAKQNYRSMVLEMLDVPVPATYANLHLRLVNGYESVYSDIDAMGRAFTDPLYALARFKQHYDDIQGIFGTIKELQEKILSDGVVYEKDEPGAYLYIFKL
jgi:hypothetical protein